ncbi:MAG: hypothetical protein LBV77_00190 [Candidatus Adiutrix intracellularis]|jgi:hypothetical protein|nr:hypothetical protein [Candidatus Adiutrix intracellularis]
MTELEEKIRSEVISIALVIIDQDYNYKWAKDLMWLEEFTPQPRRKN